MPSDLWEEFDVAYGYPDGGQRSIVFSVLFELGTGVGNELGN
jgi:hypothetical protein